MVGFLKSVGTECRYVSMITVTEVKMRKTGNPYLGAVKVSNRNGLINVNFTNSVERRVAESLGISPTQVEYTPGKTWYKHLQTAEGKPLALCVHQSDEGKYYLQYFPHKAKSVYLFKGELIAYEKLAPFVTEKEQNEFKPVVITLALKSIRQVKFRKLTFKNVEAKPLPLPANS